MNHRHRDQDLQYCPSAEAQMPKQKEQGQQQQPTLKSFSDATSRRDYLDQKLLQRIEDLALTWLTLLLQQQPLNFMQEGVAGYSIRALQDILGKNKRDARLIRGYSLPHWRALAGIVTHLRHLYYQLHFRCEYHSAMANLAEKMQQDREYYEEYCDRQTHEWLQGKRATEEWNGWQPQPTPSPQDVAAWMKQYDGITDDSSQDDTILSSMYPRYKLSDQNSYIQESKYSEKDEEEGEGRRISPTSVVASSDAAGDAVQQQHRQVFNEENSTSIALLQTQTGTGTATKPPPKSSNTDDSVQPRKQINSRVPLLLALYHSSRCTNEPPSPCSKLKHCNYFKQLWSHISKNGRCRNAPCHVPHCRDAMHVLHHFRNCHSPECSTCLPVRSFMGKTKQSSISQDVNASGGLVAGPRMTTAQPIAGNIGKKIVHEKSPIKKDPAAVDDSPIKNDIAADSPASAGPLKKRRRLSL